MKKNENKIYYQSDYEQKCYVECIKTYNIALSLHKVSQDGDLYYLVKYSLSNPKKFEYIKLDTRYIDTPDNRLKLNKYDAEKKLFELYVKAYEHLSKSKKEDLKKPIVPKIKTFAKQIDLLEMIEEVEKENDVS